VFKVTVGARKLSGCLRYRVQRIVKAPFSAQRPLL
jgi:hypothetical protein